MTFAKKSSAFHKRVVCSSGKNHISRCPGVTYWFSGRSLMDKSGQALAGWWREFWGINSKLLDLLTIFRLTAERIKNLNALSGVAYKNFGAIFPFLVAPNPAPKPALRYFAFAHRRKGRAESSEGRIVLTGKSSDRFLLPTEKRLSLLSLRTTGCRWPFAGHHG